MLNWPISKCQETPAANQPLPPPCLCSKLINTAVNLGSGLLFYSTVLDVTGALARASNKPLYAFALLWMSYSLSFGDLDSGHNINKLYGNQKNKSSNRCIKRKTEKNKT